MATPQGRQSRELQRARLPKLSCERLMSTLCEAMVFGDFSAICSYMSPPKICKQDTGKSLPSFFFLNFFIFLKYKADLKGYGDHYLLDERYDNVSKLLESVFFGGL